MTRRWKFLYPFLFAILPILSIVARNPGQASLVDAAVLTALVLAGCGVVYAIAALALGFRWFHPLVPLLVLMVVVWFYKYNLLMKVANRLPGPASEIVVLVIGTVGTAAVVWWLARRPRVLDRVQTFLALVSTILVVWLSASVIAHYLRARSTVRRSILAQELGRSIPIKPSATGAMQGPRPDIYLIVLDEYANSRILRELFDFDNRAFEDSLRQLGFTIPRVLLSNYMHTSLSLPSLLNFAHLTQLTAEVGPRSSDPTLPNDLLENNRAAAFLKARGYKFLFFPSQWWISTQHNRNADQEYQVWSGLDLGREATRSDLRRSFVSTTALELLQKDYAHDADHVKRTLAGVEQVPTDPEPTFAFAHILNPHRPFVFDSDCEPRKERLSLHRSWVKTKREYVEQVQCLNRLVLGTVTALLQHSSVPPIILLQGDHGTPILGYGRAKSARAVSPAQARERFGAFGAYYLPGDGGKLFADSVTLVNVFQKLFAHYFDADISPAPDRLYFSMDHTPYAFAEFDRASLALPVAPDRDPRPGSSHNTRVK
jgi:hypothetical protein